MGESGAGGAASLKGLLSRMDSCFLAGGDLERRSNLEALLGSGSVWSNRDRLALLLSVSSIVAMVCLVGALLLVSLTIVAKLNVACTAALFPCACVPLIEAIRLNRMRRG